MVNNITFTINCNCRRAATVYTLKTCFFLSCITVNTLYEGDKNIIIIIIIIISSRLAKISGASGVHCYALTVANNQLNDYEITRKQFRNLVITIRKTPDLFGEYEENNEGSRWEQISLQIFTHSYYKNCPI
jgi:hypothetical protein